MWQVVIENPFINSPFEEPKRHFKFTDEGISNEIIEARRTSSYFIPIAILVAEYPNLICDHMAGSSWQSSLGVPP